jgi:hypothetical protein
MSKKEDLKLVFDFIADFLKDEKPVETKPVVEAVEEIKQSKTKSKSDKNIEHMLEIMKRVELKDKMRRTTPVVPLTDRDEDDIAERDQEIVSRHKNENEIDASYLKERLSDAKTFIDELSKTHPIVDSAEKPGDIYSHL